jgi:hypothetical protein
LRKLALFLIIILIIAIVSPMIIGNNGPIIETKKTDNRFFDKLPIHLKSLFAEMIKIIKIRGDIDT